MQWHTRLHNRSLSVKEALIRSNISKADIAAAGDGAEQRDTGTVSHGAYGLQKEALVLKCFKISVLPWSSCNSALKCCSKYLQHI